MRPWSSFALRARAAAGNAVVALVALLLGADRAQAHPFLDDRLVLLDRQIAAEPTNPQLLISRGGLLLEEGHADDALPDFDRALALDPQLDVAHLLRSRACLALARPDEARTEALRFLGLVPDSARGWSHLAAVESARGDRDAALAAFARYFALAQQPRPEDFLARAELQQAAGDLVGAQRGLDEGVERLGPLISLLVRALEIELQRADPAGALATVDRLIAASPEDERWLIARAETLARLDRAGEAATALETARAALAARSPVRRDAPALRNVAERIDRLTHKLAAP